MPTNAHGSYLPSPASCQITAFTDRAPWWGGDLQTLRNQIMERQSALPSRPYRLVFQTSDGSGDQLTGTLERPLGPQSGPLIVLIHGLTGSEDSVYVRESARFHLVRGRPVLRLNLRGAGDGRSLARGYYHAGCASDLQDILDGLAGEEKQKGFFLVGFSLGGNILLNLLGRVRPGHGVMGAATVSAPIEPSDARKRLMAPRNVLYHRFLLSRMKRDVLAAADLSQLERSAVANAASIYDFDDRFVAPKNGFRDAPDYYERTAGARQVPAITVPTLMLAALNDPWIPAGAYFALRGSLPACVSVVIARSGGHVGFHERGHSETWYDRRIDDWIVHVQAARSLTSGFRC